MAASLSLDDEGASPFAPSPLRPSPRPWHQRLGAQPASRGGLRPLIALLALAMAIGAGIGLRRSVVAAVPETAALYAALGLPVNLRGLELRGVKSMVFRENGVELLIVQGEIVNVAGVGRTAPLLRFSLRDGKGAEIYAWNASPDVIDLGAGGKATFRKRLASPPAEAAEVLVRFAGRLE